MIHLNLALYIVFIDKWDLLDHQSGKLYTKGKFFVFLQMKVIELLMRFRLRVVYEEHNVGNDFFLGSSS